MKIYKKSGVPASAKNGVITIVSGLPRCGTSMMMQMLEAGGMPIMTDNIRKPDVDNPRGYYEFEKAKEIKEDSSWMKDCFGKAFKMVSALLYFLPEDNAFKVIFMKRDMQEMLASQKMMLERLGQNDNNLSDEEMAQKFAKHLQKVVDWLAEQDNIDTIFIDYNEVIQDPNENVKSVNRFLGGDLNLDKMVGVVERSLYRQRKKRN